MKIKHSSYKKAIKKDRDALAEIAQHDRRDDEKRPKEIPVDDLYLDPHNPRLAETAHTGTQASIRKVMAREFDLQPLIDSIYKNGFFWEEPLVAVVEPLPELRNKKVPLIIEGNRRLAALKTILDDKATYREVTARKRLERIPVIFRDKREDTLAFVGFRHITGIVPWESAAKAQYAHDLVKRGHSLAQIAQTIGDKTQDIARWVRTQSLVEQAHQQGLDEKDVAKNFYFSYLLTSTDAPATKRWLEMTIDPDSGLVKKLNPERLEELWMWLYGSKSRELSPIVPESRQIHKLNKVIASPSGVQELQRTGNLERALVETKDRAEYVIETLGSIRSLLQDLAANLAGEEEFKIITENKSQVAEAEAEFARVEKAIKEVKSKLGF